MKPKPYPKSWSRELKISLYMDDARKARLQADLERHTVRHAPLSWLGAPIAVGVIDIPIWQEKAVMTTQEKIDYLKNLAAPHTQVNTTRVSNGQFDPRPVFTNASVHALFPAAPADDFSDGRSNGATDGDDDTTEHSNLGMAADLINCEISGESGPGCGHDCDHISRAIDCLTNYRKEDMNRKRNLADVSNAHTVRFA